MNTRKQITRVGTVAMLCLLGALVGAGIARGADEQTGLSAPEQPLTPAQLDARIAAHNDAVAAFEQQLEQFHRERASYERDVDQHNAAVANWEREAAAWSQQDSDLAGELHAHNREIDAHNAAVADHDSEVAQYESDVATYGRDLSTHEAQAQYYENDVESFNEDSLRYGQAVDGYEAALRDYEEDLADYNADVQAYESALAEYGRELAAYNSEVEQFNALPPDQQTDFWYDRLVRWKAELDRRADQLDGIKSQLDQRHARLVNDKAWLDAKRRELESWQQRLEDQAAELEGRRTALQRERQGLDARYATLGQRSEQLTAQAANVNQRKEALDNQGAALNGRLQSTEADGAELHRRANELDESKANLDRRHAELQQWYADFERRATMLQEEADYLNGLARANAGTKPQPDITVPADLRDAVGDTPVPQQRPRPKLHLDGTWSVPAEIERVEELVNQTSKPRLQQWMIDVLHYKRRPGKTVSGFNPVTIDSAQPPTVAIYDLFFKKDVGSISPPIKPSNWVASLPQQKSYLGFEAGKAFYLSQIEPRKELSEMLDNFRSSLTDSQRQTFDEMQRGAAGGDANLRGAGDNLGLGDFDSPSKFGYVFRVVLFDLPAPPTVSQENWNAVRDKFYAECLAPQFFEPQIKESQQPNQQTERVTKP